MRLSKLVLYIVGKVSDEIGEVPTTKLIKILYLIDVEYYRSYRKTLTDLPWIFYHYGPYSSVIAKELNELGFDLEREDRTTRAGHKAVTYRLGPGPGVDIDEELGFAEKSLVDRTIDRWALVDLPEILDFVYFHTEPMEGARRGAKLDFSQIPKRQRHQEAPELPSPPVELLENLRKRVAQEAARSYEPPQLTPAPRYDNVYWDAISARDREEQAHPPKGRLQIDDKAKRSISKVTE